MRVKTTEQADKILNVAVRLFATQRFHETRMEDVAAEAGVGKGTLYRYFKDKEELYLALLERASDQMTERLQAAVQQADDPRGKLEALTDTILIYFDEQPHVFDLIQHAEAQHLPHQRFPWQARAVSIELTTAVIREAQACRLIRPMDPAVPVLMLLGGLRAVLRFGDKPRSPDLAEQIVEQFLGGLLLADASGCSLSAKKQSETISVN